MVRLGRLLMIAILLGIAGCGKGPKLHPYNEVVLSPGEKVIAENENGKFSVSYVDEVARKFTWNGESKVVEMIPRTDRFRGKLGIYNPAFRFPGFGWYGVRVVAQEEQAHFDSKEEAREWLNEGSAFWDWVYTNEGLVAGFSKTPSRNQINISLFQIYINGKRPESLDGARPDKIEMVEKEKQ